MERGALLIGIGEEEPPLEVAENKNRGAVKVSFLPSRPRWTFHVCTIRSTE